MLSFKDGAIVHQQEKFVNADFVEGFKKIFEVNNIWLGLLKKYFLLHNLPPRRKSFFLLSVIELLHSSLKKFFDNLNGHTVRVLPS